MHVAYENYMHRWKYNFTVLCQCTCLWLDKSKTGLIQNINNRQLGKTTCTLCRWHRKTTCTLCRWHRKTTCTRHFYMSHRFLLNLLLFLYFYENESLKFHRSRFILEGIVKIWYSPLELLRPLLYLNALLSWTKTWHLSLTPYFLQLVPSPDGPHQMVYESAT